MESLNLPSHQDVVAAAARLAGRVRRTPVLRHDAIDALAGARVFVKAESLQETGSFKIRGATNRLLQIPAAQRAAGVVAFSSGNHAQGVARAARLLGMPALIVMPADAPAVKADGVRADGGEIVFYDPDTENREEIAARIAAERGAILVPSYDDFDIIAGQGSSGLEFAAQMAEAGETMDTLLCGAGGGGLISGVALALEGVSPQTRIWTVEPEGYDDWARSLASGRIEANAPGRRSVCDAILTPKPGVLTFTIGKRLLSGGLVVSDEEAKNAMRVAFRYLKTVVEPGGCVALAAALRGLPESMRGGTVGLLVTGGNVDADFYADVLTTA
ncbi:MAG: threonine/serine dehydratase [Hyphomonas sp.]|nr:threonine/serine dehydratase [Hyphomonas sp.]MCB9971398.1 threonine/serine dehydratase [Hyphomonas sp.]